MGKKRNRSKARKKAEEQTTMAATSNPVSHKCFGHPVTRAVRLNDKAWLWGGSETKMRSTMQGNGIGNPNVKFALGFDLAGYGKLYQSPSIVEGTNGAMELLGKDLFYGGDSCEAVAIDWPDGGTPKLSRRWWEMLSSRLVKMEGHVAVNCYGGHGRTGTFLAIIACLLDEVPFSVCPVEWIRDKMGCDEQVETYSQCDYIERMTGRKVTAEASQMGGYADWYKNTGTTTSTANAANVNVAVDQANDYIDKVKDAAKAAGFQVTGGITADTGNIAFEIREEDIGSFETWLTDYDERFDSIEASVGPQEAAPWVDEPPGGYYDVQFGEDGIDANGNTLEDYRRMGWMI